MNFINTRIEHICLNGSPDIMKGDPIGFFSSIGYIRFIASACEGLFKWVLSDSIYGSNPDFIKAIEEYPDLSYFVSVPSDTYCWLTMPITRKKKYKYKGQIR
ncbi:MAG: hypothetical protein JRI81_07405, partial [Deltaproteobacteria bacterium]|nr:hypothetical protein [Deltaproteobacteria bacterium]